MTWDTPINVQQVQRTVDYLTRGCKCKTGCDTRRCKCKKEGLQCGPSSRCVNCRNTSQYVPQLQKTEKEIQEEIQEEIRQELQKESHVDEYEDEELSSSNESDEETADEIQGIDPEVDDIMEHLASLSKTST